MLPKNTLAAKLEIAKMYEPECRCHFTGDSADASDCPAHNPSVLIEEQRKYYLHTIGDPDKECFECGEPLYLENGKYYEKDESGKLKQHLCPADD